MSLINAAKNNANSTPAFEAEDGTADASTQAAANTGATASTTTAVAAQKGGAVSTNFKANMKVLEDFKGALPVEYNTLSQVIANNGNFVERESKTNMGDSLTFTLLSFQDSFVVSPEDEDAPDDMVRYSLDGVVCSDDTPVAEHLEYLRNNGYPKAKLKERIVVVAAVEAAAKTDKFNGTLMQLDLSPMSRVQWKRFMANAAYGLAIGKYTEEQVKRVKAVTEVATGSNKKDYTLAKFEVA